MKAKGEELIVIRDYIQKNIQLNFESFPHQIMTELRQAIYKYEHLEFRIQDS